MVSIGNFAGSTRISQLVLSAVHLALNGKLTENGSGVSSLVSELNELGNTSFALQDFNVSSGLSLASSGFTLTSQPILTLISVLTTEIEHDASDLNAKRYGINKKQTAYLTGVSTSEVASVGLWFTTFIYQTAKYGSWDCSNPASLVNQYNLTGNSIEDGLDEFFGLITSGADEDSLSSATNDSDIDSSLQELWNLTSTPINISKLNSTGQLTQSQLFIRLTQDCYMKKASIGVSFFGFIFFLVSSGIVSYTFLKLRQDLNGVIASNPAISGKTDPESNAGGNTNNDNKTSDNNANNDNNTSDNNNDNNNNEKSTGDSDFSTPTTPTKIFKLGYSYANIFPGVSTYESSDK